MPDLFHSVAIENTLLEVKTAAQQAQITLAAAQETLQTVNALVERLTRIVDAISTARQS